MRDREHYSCPEIRGDGAWDQSSDSGDGGGGGVERHLDLGTIFEREVKGHLPMIRC